MKNFFTKYTWLIIAAIFLCAGIAMSFLMTGREIVGYISFAAALITVLFYYLHKKGFHKTIFAIVSLLCMACILFGVVEIPIIRDAQTDKNPKAEYVVVLGAGVNGTNPSLSLKNRLTAALDYLNTYPNAKAIVSGGQGQGEDITEAEAMRIWLEKNGIEHSRIIEEDKSTSTKENLMFSINIISEEGYRPADGVAIISSEYHLHRAKILASSLGAIPKGVAAQTTLPVMKINYFIREGLIEIYTFVFDK